MTISTPARLVRENYTTRRLAEFTSVKALTAATGLHPDAKWTGNLVNCLPGRQEVVDKLKENEEALCRLPGWIDHGTHVLIIAQPKPVATKRPKVYDAPAARMTST